MTSISKFSPSTKPTPASGPSASPARSRNRAGGLVGLVGVQSNQFPHAYGSGAARCVRLACRSCIGGFHVSGCLAMLPEMPDLLKEALDLGISLFAGEAEGRFTDVLRDAARGDDCSRSTIS